MDRCCHAGRVIPADLLVWAFALAVPAFVVVLVVMARAARREGAPPPEPPTWHDQDPGRPR